MALIHAAKEALWLSALAKEMGIKTPESIPLLCDNQSTIAITGHAAYHSKTKHMDVKYHWLREAVEKKVFEIKYVSTTDQCADMMTKQLKPAVLQRNLLLNRVKKFRQGTPPRPETDRPTDRSAVRGQNEDE
jgi:hypothetical protein